MKLAPGMIGVVTGAASGLGRSLALQFAARGLTVVLADVEAAPLADAVADVERAGAPALGVPTDVRSADQVAALAAVTLEQFGRVDLVVNNAGVSAMPGPMWSYEVNDWEWVLSVNLWGAARRRRPR